MEAAQLFLYCILDVEAVCSAYACIEGYTTGQQYFAHTFTALNILNG